MPQKRAASKERLPDLRANLLLRPGEVAMREVETPRAGPGEVLVRVRAALTCGTDLKAFLRGHPQIPMPGPFGHEFSGEIAAVGPGVRGFREGDAVMAVHSAPCGDCYWCRRGQENLCETVMGTKVLGAYAEYIKLPAHIVRQNLFEKPGSLPFEEAALLEPLACVIYGLGQILVRPDDAVLLIGAGAIALLHVLVLRAMGCSRVVVAGRRPYRLNLARELGAGPVLDVEREEVRENVLEATAGRGADVVIECTGRPEVWEQAVSLVRRGGQVVLFGGCPKGTTVAFDTARLHYDQISLVSPFHFTPAAVRRAYQLLAGGKIRAGRLITDSLPLDKLAQAFALLQESRDCVKYALIP